MVWDSDCSERLLNRDKATVDATADATPGITQQITCTCRCLQFCNLPCRRPESFSLPTGEIRVPPTCLHLGRTNFPFPASCAFLNSLSEDCCHCRATCGSSLRSTSFVPGQIPAFSKRAQCRQDQGSDRNPVQLQSPTITITFTYRISVTAALLRAVRLVCRPSSKQKLTWMGLIRFEKIIGGG
jgi:hypothetical protein